MQIEIIHDPRSQHRERKSYGLVNEIKRLGGMKSTNSSIIHQINIDRFEDISEHELANRINTSFLEPLAEYQLSSP